MRHAQRSLIHGDKQHHLVVHRPNQGLSLSPAAPLHGVGQWFLPNWWLTSSFSGSKDYQGDNQFFTGLVKNSSFKFFPSPVCGLGEVTESLKRQVMAVYRSLFTVKRTESNILNVTIIHFLILNNSNGSNSHSFMLLEFCVRNADH